MNLRLLVLLGAACAACADATRVTAPQGAAEFARFVSIGTGLTMGEQSGGVVNESQISAWPVRLATRMGAPFVVPALRLPGCTPPLVAPLALNRDLAGPTTSKPSCNGRLGSETLPANNVALAGATAWDVLHTSPRSFVVQAGAFDQVRYPLILPSQQTQLQAMQAQRPTLVAVELGSGEVMRALRTGLVVSATSYSQSASWTLVPAALFVPVFDSIADSVKATGAKAVFLGVPPMTSLPSWRSGEELSRESAALAAYGVEVAADCASSGNLVNTVLVLPSMVAAARESGTRQRLSCTDRPGQVDYILTPQDVASIAQTIVALNGAIKAAADKRDIPFVDVPLFWREVPYAAPAFTATGFLDSDAPFGRAMSLDGVQPSAVGQELLADRVAAALNQKYGWKIPVPSRAVGRTVAP